MKKINLDSMYDIDTSKELAKWKGNKTKEILYITESGKYFLYTEDGIIFKLQIQKDEKRWFRGVDIIPFTLDQAMQWAKARLTDEEYSTIFESKIESDTRNT